MITEIGVSLASVFPVSLGLKAHDSEAPERTVGVVQKAGLDGIQLLPFRGWGDFRSALDATKVISIEDRWGKGLQHWSLFGNEASSSGMYQSFIEAYPSALRSSHHWGDGLVELHPEMGHTPRSLEELESYEGLFVVDLYHIRRSGRQGQPSILQSLGGKKPEEVVHFLIRHKKLAMVHFQPSRDTPWDAAESDALYRMMILANCAQQHIPVIIETKPILGSRDSISEYLMEVREFILRCV